VYQYATNLFARLSRYSLKPKKSPLENFCTELLAWCLQKSVGFQSEFLKLIQLDFLKNLKGAIEIRTQQYWIDKEDDQDENGDEDHKERPRGFFDLEFESPQDLNGQGELFIAIESKIGADFKPGQLPKYRAELAKRGANYNHCYLITLTTRSKKPDLAHAHIKWSQVQELLTKVPVEEKLDIIYKQFADFLKQKGIAPMKIKKIDSEVLKGWSNCFDCQRDLWRILDNVRKSGDAEKICEWLRFAAKEFSELRPK